MRSVLDDSSYRTWTWLVLAILLAAAIYLVAVQRWLGVAVLGATIAISIAFIRFEDRLPRVFNLLFVLAGALNAGAYVFDLWDRVGAYDELVHAYTTFAVAAAFGYLALDRSHLRRGDHFWTFVALVTAFGFGVGVLWEAFEWLIGIIGDMVDTLVDLVMDTLGAVAAGFFCAWAVRQGRGERNAEPAAAFSPRA